MQSEDEISADSKKWLTILNKEDNEAISLEVTYLGDAISAANFLEHFYGIRSMVSFGDTYEDSICKYITFPEVKEDENIE